MSSFVILIGQRLRQYRLQKHLTQEQLAERAGLHPTYIGQVERGEKNLTIESLYRISLALQIPLSQLFGQIPAIPEENDTVQRCMLLLSAQNEATQKVLLQMLELACELPKHSKK